jgi:hypothetical protein
MFCASAYQQTLFENSSLREESCRGMEKIIVERSSNFGLVKSVKV